jgi:hypothetical protein
MAQRPRSYIETRRLDPCRLFLRPQQFYDTLDAMSEEERKCIYMTSVLTVNQLWDNQYAKEELSNSGDTLLISHLGARFLRFAFSIQ